MTEPPEEALDDFDRIVASLNRHRVDFMIIGGFAVVYHGHVRNTKDLDLYVRRSAENAERIVAALEEVIDWIPPDDDVQAPSGDWLGA